MQSSTEERSKLPTRARSRSPAEGQRNNIGDNERVLSSLIGGALLLSALRAPSPASAVRLIGGTALLHRGVTGHCYVYSALGRSTATTGGRDAVRQSITIGKSAEALYRLWQDPKHMSAIMKDFAHVEGEGDDRWRWTASLPGGRKLTWTTSSTAQRPGELIAWRTEADAPFEHEGSVSFRKAPRDLGTEVTLTMSFGAAHGPMRKLTSTLFKALPRLLEESILRRSKSLSESGEIPTLEHNSSAREPARIEHATKPRMSAGQPARSLS